MNERQIEKTGQGAAGKPLRAIALRALLALALFGAGYAAARYSLLTGEEAPCRTQELHALPDLFINPLVECNEHGDGFEFSELRPFKHKIAERVDRLKQDHGISHISIYFRDLNNGPWFGIDEREKFTPASLMKVPMMIASFKIAEAQPAFLQRTAVKTDTDDLNSMETIRPTRTIRPHQKYTLDELIYRMIVYSDNNALELLTRHVDHRLLEEIYADLGIPLPYSEGTEDYLTVKQYASFFRILFNASYLNKDMSKKALQYLSEVEFDRGLPAGLPPDVGIVHKFGERIIKNKDRSMAQIHDCGIIYYPMHPYLLCIMSRGRELDPLLESIQDISRLVYGEIDQQQGKQQ